MNKLILQNILSGGWKGVIEYYEFPKEEHQESTSPLKVGRMAKSLGSRAKKLSSA